MMVLPSIDRAKIKTALNGESEMDKEDSYPACKRRRMNQEEGDEEARVNSDQRESGSDREGDEFDDEGRGADIELAHRNDSVSSKTSLDPLVSSTDAVPHRKNGLFINGEATEVSLTQ